MDDSEELIKDLIFERQKKPFKRDKSKNTPEFNSKASARREKAKTAKKSRKRNRGK